MAVLVVYSAVATGGGQGGVVLLLTTACAPSLRPHFDLLKLLFLEHHATTRQQTMMEKGRITFKHNSPFKFF